MAYQVPKFNIWVEIGNAFGARRGWTKCQMRGPVNGLFDVEQTDHPNNTRILWEFLFPAGSDIRTHNSVGTVGGSDYDIIYIHGYTKFGFLVMWVGEKAAGFTNEYRLVFACHQIDWDVNTIPLPRVNPDFEPPPGFTPLPVAPRFVPPP